MAQAGRPRFQKGQVTVRGNWWVLRYRDYTRGGKRADYKLGLVQDHSDIRQHETPKAELRFAEQIAKSRAEINQGHTSPSGGLTVAEFIEQSYFPRCEWRLTVPDGGAQHMEPSTLNSYRDIFNVHVKNSAIAKLRLRE